MEAGDGCSSAVSAKVHVQLLELFVGHYPALEMEELAWKRLEWNRAPRALADLLERAARLASDEMMSFVNAVSCGTGKAFLDAHAASGSDLDSTEQRAVQLVADALKKESTLIAFAPGSVAFQSVEPMPFSVDLAKEVACAVIHAWLESGLSEPLGGHYVRPATVKRFASMCIGQTKSGVMGGHIAIDELVMSYSVGEQEMRNFAQNCSKALLFLNREVWRKEGSFLAAVVYVGGMPLDLKERVFEGRRDELESALDQLWKREKNGYRPTHERACFVVVTQGRRKEQIKFVRHILSNICNVQLEPESSTESAAKRLILRGRVPSSFVQKNASNACYNPVLRDALDAASPDLEVLSLAELGLDWRRNEEQLRSIGRFVHLRWLDLSMNSFFGSKFEEWLRLLLAERPTLRVVLYGTLMMLHPDTRNWKERFPRIMWDQIVTTIHAFAELQ
jgi:hypothetical protein